MADRKMKASEVTYFIPSKIVAEIVGSSENLVRAVRRGSRNGDKGKGAAVRYVDRRSYEEIAKLIPELRRAVRPMQLPNETAA